MGPMAPARAHILCRHKGLRIYEELIIYVDKDILVKVQGCTIFYN